MADREGRPKGRKYEQVLEGAREVFLADGFEGASVDAIALAAGVSKATLYSYFPDKRAMFSEVVRRECLRQAEQATASIPTTAPPREVLRAAAEHLLEFILSDFAQGIFRICVAEAARFPELGQAFYDSGPRLGTEAMTAYFEEAEARGELRIDDPELAAAQFQNLCKAGLYEMRIFDLRREFTPEEKARVIDGAVEMFLARYGT